MHVEELVFVGFNSRVAALDRRSGDIVWDWRAPSGSGFVSLLVDGPQLFVAVTGYQYCLDALTGEQIWFNPMKGFGYGVSAIATATSASGNTIVQQAAAANQQDQTAQSHVHGSGVHG